jgi:hypothetical protein
MPSLNTRLIREMKRPWKSGVSPPHLGRGLRRDRPSRALSVVVP